MLLPISRLEADLAVAAELAANADSPATRKALRSDLEDWARYAVSRGSHPQRLDPVVVTAYLASLSVQGRRLSTIRRRLTSLNRLAAHLCVTPPGDTPDVRMTMRGIARDAAATGRTKQGKRAVTPAMVAKFVARPTTTLRDASIMLIGTATGLRRSELAGMTWENVRRTKGGWLITIPTSKTDQFGKGQAAFVARTGGPLCPARQLDRLSRHQGGPKEGPVLGCSADTVNRVVKACASLAGEDPRHFGGHSLRAAFCTIASKAGVGMVETMGASRHADPATMVTYYRDDDVEQNRTWGAVARVLDAAAA